MLSDVIVAFDHLKHTVTILANAYLDERRAASTPRTRARRGDPPRSASASPARCRAPAHRAASASRTFESEHAARDVRGDGRPDRRVRPRRRRLPGRPVPALVRAHAGRAVLDLPRAARGQPVAVHVLPRLRGLPDRRRLARAAADGLRPPRLDAPDRRHPPARRDADDDRDRRRAARRREGARRARDARRPRPQRPRARVRVRHACTSSGSWTSRPTRT